MPILGFRGLLQGIRDCGENWFLVLRCSALGSFMGMIPGIGASVIDWPDGVPRLSATQMPSAAVSQRFNGTGRARPRIVAGLARDLSAIASVRASAADRRFTLVVGALNGFEEAQRAIHIFSNELPQRSTMKGEVLRAYVEQIDAMVGSIVRDFPDHMVVIVSPSGPVASPLAATPYALLRDWISSEDPGADDGFVLMTGGGIGHPEKQTEDSLRSQCARQAGGA